AQKEDAPVTSRRTSSFWARPYWEINGKFLTAAQAGFAGNYLMVTIPASLAGQRIFWKIVQDNKNKQYMPPACCQYC
ncbi:hypothetical protein, partial [uncultured Cloacibacillus sp.]|uniref:hypothetical protein n=1 Tax=uncultured Cloacibacillus sp. TaxID=889794 RepID=UPI0025881FBB